MCAANALGTCLNVGPDDRLVLFTDVPTAAIGAAVEREARARTEHVVVVRLEELGTRPLLDVPDGLPADAFTEAQHDTAMAVYGCWVDAGLAPRASGWFGSGGGWDGADDAPTARDRYRAMMRRLTTVQVLAVERMLWGLGVPAAMLGDVRTGLDLLEGIRCDE